eukprot:1148826-Pelagomonas_calceolata.AAC.2
MILTEKKEKKTYAGSENTPHIHRHGKGDTRGRGTMYPPHQGKQKKAMGIRRVTSRSPCLILLMRAERSLLESLSGASKFVSILDRISMKLQSKLGGLVSVKPNLYKRLKSVGAVDDPADT